MPRNSRKKTNSRKSKNTKFKLQSIIIPMTVMSESAAKKWVKKHYGNASKIDITPNTYRFRLLNPDAIKATGYRRFRTKVLTNGIELILAYKR